MYNENEIAFEWDRAKLSHIARHNVTSAETEQALVGYTIDLGWQTFEDEERLVQVGQTQSGRVLTVITTWRGESVRVVTAFDASPGFRHLFLSSISGERHV